MNSAITVLFDDSCGFCRQWARRGQALLGARGIRFEPMINGSTASEMCVVAADGREFWGADSLMFLCRQLWLTWPLWLVSRLPGMMPVLRRGYAWVAARRHCLGGTCERREWQRTSAPAQINHRGTENTEAERL